MKSLGEKRKNNPQKKTKSKSLQISSIENQLIEKLGTKVTIRSTKKGGIIEVSYFSDEDLNRILEIFELLSD